ncbi:MAG TPA: hypothetical protein VLA17_02475 [Candidatus Limnocylindria bacterium]|nr:hypothetical protein [Candidatus Limnocylindria bacterium]
MNQSSRNTENENKSTRREFGKGALWVAPTVTVLLAASAQPARAESAPSGPPPPVPS